MKSIAKDKSAAELYLRRNAMGLLAHLLIEHHDEFLRIGNSTEIDTAFNTLSAHLFGHRTQSAVCVPCFAFLQEQLSWTAGKDCLKELNRNFSEILKCEIQ